MKSNQGTVLLFMLGIAATVSAVLVLMQSKAIEDINRIKKHLDETESYYLAQSGHQLAHRLLKDDLSKGIFDGMSDNWYALHAEERTYPIGNGQIKLHLQDQTSIPNINQLYTAIKSKDLFYKNIFRHYLKSKAIQDKIIPQVVDWIDQNDTVSSNGAEKTTYMNKQPSYTTANEKMISLDEVKLLDSYQPRDFLRIEKYLTALPYFPKLNINTIDQSLLLAAYPQVSNNKMREFLAKRKFSPYVTLLDAQQDLEVLGDPQGLEFTISSTFFKLSSTAEIREHTRGFEILYHRNAGKVKIRRFQWL